MSDGVYAGVAPEVVLIGLKVLDASGTGYTSDVISALEFAVRNKAALGIDIINLSLGHPPYESAVTDPLVQAVQHASAAGIVVVVSGGNVGLKASTGRPAYAGILSRVMRRRPLRSAPATAGGLLPAAMISSNRTARAARPGWMASSNPT